MAALCAPNLSLHCQLLIKQALCSISAYCSLLLHLHMLLLQQPQVISNGTRARMLRDHSIRQFRKQHMNDLWDVIRAEK
jgi:hypothetical protein